MTKPITNLNDAFDLFFEGGTVQLRLKEGIIRETLLDEKLEKLKILILDNHPLTISLKRSKYVIHPSKFCISGTHQGLTQPTL